MVDHIFPPASDASGHVSTSHALTYSTFTYWREPLAEVSLYFEDETKKSDTNNLQQNSGQEDATAETEMPDTDTTNN